MVAVQSLGRAFSLLDIIAAEPTGLSDLARQADLPISTVSRLVGTLEELGAVERVDELGLFRIGSTIVTLANSVADSRSLEALAAEELEALSADLGEDVGLSVPAGFTMHYVAQVAANTPVQVQDWVGTRLPMHTVSSGLVVLANWAPEAVDAYLERDLPAPTANTVTDPDVIRTRLDDVRAEGFAWTREELEVGINSVAAPLFAAGEVVGAIHSNGPAFRFPGAGVGGIQKAVRSAAERINLLLN